MVSERAFSNEASDVREMPAEAHMLGEEDEEGPRRHPRPGIDRSTAEASVEETTDDDNIDLEAALGGGIKKAPAAETEPEAESAEPAPVRSYRVSHSPRSFESDPRGFSRAFRTAHALDWGVNGQTRVA